VLSASLDGERKARLTAVSQDEAPPFLPMSRGGRDDGHSASWLRAAETSVWQRQARAGGGGGALH
jgi:alpha-D-ribose 1-methylphosphonate 5-triphosphate synthase subunit PhnG